MTRRHALALLSGTAVTAGCQRKTNAPQTFSTIAFGTEVNFLTYGLGENKLQSLQKNCLSRLSELEALFSLYRPESAISSLNRSGKLENAPPEFIRLIQTSLDIASKTSGLFDITVQPLWNWRQKWKEADLETRRQMESSSWQETLSLVDFRKISIDGRGIAFGKPGMAISLNGIAQGYATEQIKSILQNEGVTNALINIGEYSALGSAPNGKPWEIEIRNPFHLSSKRPLNPGRALAVSAGYSYTFDPEGRFHHIFRPRNGSNPKPTSTIVVEAHSATIADALATTLAIATASEQEDILKVFAGVNIEELKP